MLTRTSQGDMMREKLTQSFVKTVTCPDGKALLIVRDTQLPGFGLKVTKTGHKSFYAERRVGKGRDTEKRYISIGTYGTFTVEQARGKAGEFLRAFVGGSDIMAEVRATKEAKAATKAAAKASEDRFFEAVLEDYLARKVRGILARDKQTEGQLRLHFLPSWSGRDVTTISKRDVLDVLERLEDKGKGGAARKSRALISAFFSFAMSRDLIQTNPASGRGLTSTKYVPRTRVLDNGELVEVWKAAEKQGYPFAPLFQLLILSGQRLREVAEAPWSEFNLDAGVWTIPAQRTKMRKAPHDVHITPQMKAILDALPRMKGSPFLFTTTLLTPVSGFTGAKRKVDKAIAEARQEAAGETEAAVIPQWTPHDFRRSLGSGMQALGLAMHVVERVINHTPSVLRGVGAIYQRHEYLPERKAALEAWGRHVENLLTDTTTSNVVPIRA